MTFLFGLGVGVVLGIVLTLGGVYLIGALITGEFSGVERRPQP